MFDKLFISWNCPDCTEIKNVLDMGYVIDDDKFGNHSQHLILIQTYSNIGVNNILKDYFPETQDNLHTPILKTYDNKIIKETNKIIEYLKEEGYNKKYD